MRQLAITLAVAAAVLGCHPKRQPATESVGTEGAGAPRQFTVVEDVRIGSQSDPDIGFTSVGGVVVGCENFKNCPLRMVKLVSAIPSHAPIASPL